MRRRRIHASDVRRRRIHASDVRRRRIHASDVPVFYVVEGAAAAQWRHQGRILYRTV